MLEPYLFRTMPFLCKKSVLIVKMAASPNNAPFLVLRYFGLQGRYSDGRYQVLNATCKGEPAENASYARYL